jgi:hypothetical protein
VAPPAITIGIDSQHLADGDVVSPNPTFTIALEDSSGFDFSGAPVRLYFDDESVEEDRFTLTHESQSIRQAIVTFHAEVVTGQHHLLVEATDINGNTGTQGLDFTVEGDFELVAIANHPNPFTDKTIIAFTLQDLAEEVRLDIYTVSGRLIRSFTDLNDVSGYIEKDWDGMDDDGNEVANGVYYLRFTAKKGDKKIERIEKMAKLK